ncbi:flavin reductase family protein [Erythrobacter sp.]|uniref:flavin reductase family protein n=1 Tax=Erythrobacter sp. TaxID=1042 RepID=UPI0025CC98DE|nr:flavin reductase family protein [Erythrobacter sp.]
MPDSLTPADFRQLMGQFATGVAVVSVLTESGNEVAAMTINSLVSVSLDPMLVCWNLQNSSSQFALYAGAKRFAVSILAEGQQSLARRYAARGSTALSPADFETGPDGLPVIAGALGHVACRRFAAHAAGDHTLILGQVEGMAQAASALRPLVFFGGRFEEIAP